MTEGKKISEAFPNLKTAGGLSEYLEEARVTGAVLVDRAEKTLRIRLISRNWIKKKYIYELEDEIKNQLFSDTQLTIRIDEEFFLSQQYTPEYLWDVYRQSMLLECKTRDILLFPVLQKAGAEFDGDLIRLTLTDTPMAREKEKELRNYLDEVFASRCHMPVKVEISYAARAEAKAGGDAAGSEYMTLDNPEDVPGAAEAPWAEDVPGAEEVPWAEDAPGAAEVPWAEDVPSGIHEGSDLRAADQAGDRPDEQIPAPDAHVPGEQAAVSDHDTGAAAPDAGGHDKGVKTAPPAGKKTGSRKKKKKDAETGTAEGDPADPEQIFGKRPEGERTSIKDIDETAGSVLIHGQIVSFERRETKGGKSLLIISVTDYTDTIRAKLFLQPGEADPVEKDLTPEKGKDKFVVLQGQTALDPYDKEIVITRVRGIRKAADIRGKRHDDAAVKRVELSCHTRMSEMDGVSSAAALIRRAYEWGHPAIAITDHGGVQAFPEAMDELGSIDKKYAENYISEHPEISDEQKKGLKAPFKVIYGCDACVVDDLRGIAVNEKGQSLRDSYVVFDIETTGLSNLSCRIIEIGAVRVRGGEICDRFSTFVNPRIPIPFNIEKLTGISDSMVVDAPPIEEALPDFLEFCGDDAFVAHNADFDIGFIRRACEQLGIRHEFTRVDTVSLAHFLLPQLNRFTLERVAKELQVPLGNHHRAVDDAECTAGIFVKFIQMLEERDIHTLKEMNEAGALDPGSVARLREHHALILAKNETGRVNLYRLISEAHLHYMKGKPKFPKSVINRFREGLIIGSGNEEGELIQAILSGESDEDIASIVSFYDFLEVPVPANMRHLIYNEREEHISGEEDIRDIVRTVVKLGKQFEKPVAASADVHYLDPEDVLYRRIIKEGKPRKDRDEFDQDSCYFRTTGEMLEDFDFLGAETAMKIVVEDPRAIADMIERVRPIRDGKFPPVIADSDKLLREICEKRAHDIYGPELPAIVSERLEKELTSLITNGYAVLYIIAQKLVSKCQEDGSIVGSRGSVGSSFAATMAGITEVNPLPPHYLCGSCHYVDFDSETVQSYAKVRMVGNDLPDRDCPVCGKPLQKLGFQIPFETFLGFKGNKEPDIDLNFSGAYQSRAHKYTEEIFGHGQTYRAGTIGTMAEKTAVGFVKKYFEERGEYKRKSEIERLVKNCVGIRRTTGQHPGGVIVLPIGEDINSFTPVQYPADDPESGVISTHFDYHSIDKNLLKLDLLGHDDPSMIQMLQELTGIDAADIVLNDPGVLSLFRGTEALGITPDQIGGCPLGCLGVPEFGTRNTMNMVLDIRPKDLTDLIRISGLAHGQEVWHGNAKELIEEGRCTIAEAICTRDDIMAYLIGMGLDSELAFKIMEKVRKGGGLTPEWEKEMLAHNVPEWYIGSCNHIKYMFPKAHAVAYVTMACRIAWYKIYRPLAYYAAYFSIRASSFDYETMCFGPGRLNEFLMPLRKRYNTDADRKQMSHLEKERYRDMCLAEEMYARGYSFVPIELDKAEAHRCRIVDDAIMPALDSIEGLGEKAADNIVNAVREGPFISKDDFRARTKSGKSMTDILDRLGIMGGLPESNQFSLFDL